MGGERKADDRERENLPENMFCISITKRRSDVALDPIYWVQAQIAALKIVIL